MSMWPRIIKVQGSNLRNVVQLLLSARGFWSNYNFHPLASTLDDRHEYKSVFKVGGTLNETTLFSTLLSIFCPTAHAVAA